MFKELLATEQLAELGPGRREGVLPEAEVREKLAECFKRKALGMEPQHLITALVLLWHDHLDSSHTIAQGIPSADGSYVHGMMHRREPDYWNSKYWFRRVGSHPAFLEIAKRAGVLLEGKAHGELRKRLLPEGKWDALAFIDACESAAKSRDPGGTALLRKVQAVEFEVLLDRCSSGEGNARHTFQPMREFLTVFGAVIPIFAIAGIGLLLRKLNWLTEEADQSLLRVSINVLYPCLIFDAALGNPALSRMSNLLLAPLVGFGTVVLGYLLAWLARPLHGLRSQKENGTFVLTTGLYNYTYAPLPLALLLFAGSDTVGVLFVHNVGVEVAMWTIGVMLLGGSGGWKEWRRIVNAPLVAIVVALFVNAVGGGNNVPGPARTVVHWLGQCAVPMALILIGAIVADHLREFHAIWGLRVISSAVLLRIVVLPMVFLLLARYLPASVELKRVIVLEAAMPSAVFPIVMSKHYGGDPPTALRVVIGTSVVGLLTIPFWIRFGMKFAGL